MKKEKIKILIIEDEKFLIKAYRIKFEKSGYDVSVASDGEEGLKLVKKEMPKLIVLDLMLPKMSGFEFLKKIKSDKKTKDITIVALSNLGQRSDQEKAFSLGVDEYFIKTEHTLEEIINKIGKYVK